MAILFVQKYLHVFEHDKIVVIKRWTFLNTNWLVCLRNSDLFYWSIRTYRDVHDGNISVQQHSNMFV